MNNEACIQDGIIIKQEERKTVDKIKAWYYEKFIKTGKAAKFEEGVEKRAKFEKKAIVVAGTIATVALVFCPADGPFGELCTVLATPALCKLVDVCAELEKKVTLKWKRSAEKTMGFGTAGYSSNVENPEITKDDIVDAAKIVKGASDDIASISRGAK